MSILTGKMIFNAFLHTNYYDNDGYVASNSPNGFHQGVIKDRNWWANEMHSNMISIINVFDLILTYSRPRHFSKDVFILCQEPQEIHLLLPSPIH